MRRRSCIVMLTVVATMFVAACSPQKRGDVSKNGVMVANTWVEVTNDDIAKKTGFVFNQPDNATEIVYRMDENSGVCEMVFNIDKVKWNARVKQTDAPEDISGMYYEWTSVSRGAIISDKTTVLTGDLYQYYTNSEKAYLGVWFYESPSGAKYSLSLSGVSNKDIPYSPASEVFTIGE